jgi:hypothetical protein
LESIDDDQEMWSAEILRVDMEGGILVRAICEEVVVTCADELRQPFLECRDGTFIKADTEN